MKQIKNQSSKTLYLDCSSGISGDMTVAALLDLGADSKVLLSALSSLPLDGYQIKISNVIKSGLKACDFHVILDEAHENHDHDMNYLYGSFQNHPARNIAPDISEHTHDPASSVPEHTHGSMPAVSEHHHAPVSSGCAHAHHHGRNLDEIAAILSAGKLTPRALELSMKIFRIVAEAESQVHGKPLDEVHFHEVGAVDSIIDIAAVAVCIDHLGIERVILPCLTEGTGQVRCQHGLLPIPVPATAAIAAAYSLPLHICSVPGELVTPTGAAIAAALRTDSKLPSEFRILKTGLGAGKREYQTAGILRAMLIEESGSTHDTILVMETNMDDCYGEAMGFVMEELLENGALDAFYTPIYMKKHRPAYKLSVLCSREKRTAMEEIIFRHTTTIGLRVYEAERTRLSRKIFSLETPWGMADIKCCQYGEELYYYPESDSIQQLAKSNHLSYTEMYHEVKKYASSTHPIL